MQVWAPPLARPSLLYEKKSAGIKNPRQPEPPGFELPGTVPYPSCMVKFFDMLLDLTASLEVFLIKAFALFKRPSPIAEKPSDVFEVGDF